MEGQVLFSHVSNAFDTLGRGENELKRIKNFNIGQIKIGVSNTLCKYILLPYLKGFIDEYPHVKIMIDSQDTSQNYLDAGTAETGHRPDCGAKDKKVALLYAGYENWGYLCLY